MCPQKWARERPSDFTKAARRFLGRAKMHVERAGMSVSVFLFAHRVLPQRERELRNAGVGTFAKTDGNKNPLRIPLSRESPLKDVR